MPAASWTEEENARLTLLWSTDLKAGQIADEMKKTRNGVIGKAHRLGLPVKRKPGRGRVARTPEPAGRKHKRPLPPTLLPEAAPMVAVEGGIHIRDLNDTHCRSIVGHGPDGLARYCGAQTATVQPRSTRPGTKPRTVSYCADHAAVYYQP